MRVGTRRRARAKEMMMSEGGVITPVRCGFASAALHYDIENYFCTIPHDVLLNDFAALQSSDELLTLHELLHKSTVYELREGGILLLIKTLMGVIQGGRGSGCEALAVINQRVRNLQTIRQTERPNRTIKISYRELADPKEDLLSRFENDLIELIANDITFADDITTLLAFLHTENPIEIIAAEGKHSTNGDQCIYCSESGRSLHSFAFSKHEW